MKGKIAIDQKAAWVLAIFAGLIIFGIGYFLIKLAAQNYAERATVKVDLNEDLNQANDAFEKSHSSKDVLESKDPPQKNIASWSYSKETGPQYWGKLSPDFVECDAGKFQSPIDISSSSFKRNLTKLIFSYKTSLFQMNHTGHTLKVKYDPDSYLRYKRRNYELKEITFHLPSEHTIDQVPYEMEMQLLHKDFDSHVLILSVFFEESNQHNDQLAVVWKNFPKFKGKKGPSLSFNVANLIPNKKNFYTYMGSLTEPPCYENIDWVILKDSLKVSANQIDQFHALFKNNARPVQPLGKRKVLRNYR